MFQKNPHMVRILQKKKMLSHGFSSLQPQLIDHREQVERKREKSSSVRRMKDFVCFKMGETHWYVSMLREESQYKYHSAEI